MATLVLQAVGSMVGGAIGGPIGATIGRALGGIAGAAIDARLMGGGRHIEYPHLQALNGITSTEGAPLPRVYGRCRIGGQMIWATRFEEVAKTEQAGGTGGKGGGPTQTNYTYFANFAIALCEGPIAQVRRIWADGREIDQTLYTIRTYHGDETQWPDPLIVAKEGAENVSAYRGVAYIVFERMPIADFGNRVPQLTFEIIRPIEGLGTHIQSINIIPGASEYAYAPKGLLQMLGQGISKSENRHQLTAASDWAASIDALMAICPNLKHASLIVSWFGDDLRAGHCTIAPRVESAIKVVKDEIWVVAGLLRETAKIVSSDEQGHLAYGGTPSDESVIAAIQDLTKRGLKVTFYPFIMMDIPLINMLPDPQTGTIAQPAYPWRGRITCDTASSMQSQIDAFFASYRPFIMHYAQLCKQAGGVDTFLLGSELVGLTKAQNPDGTFPTTQALIGLAQDVKAQLGAQTSVSYSADWTEYGAFVQNGGQEISFPLDDLWASPYIDFIGIDAYWPLSDWRDGREHLDAQIAPSIYELAYLTDRVSSGEAYDWYYADEAGRQAQQRLPISDGAYNKPWIYRAKDLVNWWSNPHIPRKGGQEVSSATAWIPQSKPIWLMEIGCPAVDRGANAPNMFPDPKSAQTGLPYFSRGTRDDLIQRRVLEALLTHFDPDLPGYKEGWNPVSSVYKGRMLDPTRIYLWAWDARPFPAFPTQSKIWSDAPNWQTGHWLNGRLEAITWQDLATHLVREVTDLPIEIQNVEGMCDGYQIDRPISPRGSLEPLCALFGTDAIFSGGCLRFVGRTTLPCLSLTQDDLVADKAGDMLRITRVQETDLPHELALSFCDGERDYRACTISSRKLAGGSQRLSQAQTSLVLTRAEGQRWVDVWLQDLWVGREKLNFTLRPGLIALEVGDVVELHTHNRSYLCRIETIGEGGAREVTARFVDPDIYDHLPSSFAPIERTPPPLPGPPLIESLSLAIAPNDPPPLHYLAVFADPWVRPMALWRGDGATSFKFIRTIDMPSIMGEIVQEVTPGPIGQWDDRTQIELKLYGRAALSSVTDLQLFGGSNRLALKGEDGAWEIIGFGRAELIGAHHYRLSHLIRGLGGAEELAQRHVASGARVVILDQTLVPLDANQAPLGIPTRWRVGPIGSAADDPSCVDINVTATPNALLPYAPVQAHARRTQQGTEISFIRRGRLNSDAWEPLEIPLGEAVEAYEIDVLKNGNICRTLACSVPLCIYSATQELADFGVAQTSLDLRLYQLSASVGRGFPGQATQRVVIASA